MQEVLDTTLRQIRLRCAYATHYLFPWGHDLFTWEMTDSKKEMAKQQPLNNSRWWQNSLFPVTDFSFSARSRSAAQTHLVGQGNARTPLTRHLLSPHLAGSQMRCLHCLMVNTLSDGPQFTDTWGNSRNIRIQADFCGWSEIGNDRLTGQETENIWFEVSVDTDFYYMLKNFFLKLCLQ